MYIAIIPNGKKRVEYAQRQKIIVTLPVGVETY